MFYIGLFFVLPAILLFGVVKQQGSRIDLRNFLAIIALLLAYPSYALTGKVYVVLVPLILFFILIRKDWVPQREQ